MPHLINAAPAVLGVSLLLPMVAVQVAAETSPRVQVPVTDPRASPITTPEVVTPLSIEVKQTEPGQADNGSAAILDACWTPQQLAGDTKDRQIQRHLKPDRTPPPDWAIRAAEQSLPPLAQGLAGSIRGVETADPKARLVALTFDLCEQANERAGYDAGVVNALRAAGVKATFFAGGKWMRTHPEQAMQLMADPLFEVGNHAWTHGNLRLLEGESVREQMLWPQAEYQVLRQALSERPCAVGAGLSALGRIPAWPTLFRFPYGVCNQASLDAAAGFGLAAIQWNLVTGDPDQGRSAKAIADAVRQGVKPGRGTIVVAHANGRGWHTAEALGLLIPQLRADGYAFVTVSELLVAGRPVAAQSCYEVRPGDNARYDTLFGKGTGQ